MKTSRHGSILDLSSYRHFWRSFFIADRLTHGQTRLNRYQNAPKNESRGDAKEKMENQGLGMNRGPETRFFPLPGHYDSEESRPLACPDAVRLFARSLVRSQWSLIHLLRFRGLLHSFIHSLTHFQAHGKIIRCWPCWDIRLI